ncbi:hypothetical protein ABT352_23080 [Streptosporangium sp. NPDC000563]|uniref:hypothetical protein n=1 Tax=Streptosporangium sp. NPDC000563 TaxID=3154366 RepID=UPI00331E67A3
MIRIWPRRDLRQAFAAWAVQQRPKVRTTSPVEFAVPDALIPAIPEHLLAGAWLDGQLYVAPAPDARATRGAADQGQVPPSSAAQDTGEQEEQPPPASGEPASQPAAVQEDQPAGSVSASARRRGRGKSEKGR